MCATKSLAGRIDWITSLRGIAAVTVVLCHWSNIFYPQLFSEQLAESTFEIVWRHTPLNALNNGSYGVQFFFVVSGFLITRSIYSATDGDVRFSGLKYIIKKISALSFIVIPGVLFPFILMRLNLLCNAEAAALLENDFIITYNDFYPSIFSLLKDLIRTFFSGSIYNGPLWTIPYELMGAVIISTMAFYVVGSNTKGVFSKVLYLLLFLSTFHSVPNLAAFIIGAFAYDTLKNYYDDNSLIGWGGVMRMLNEKKFIKGLLFATFFYMATINWHPVSGIWGWIPNYDPLIELIRSVGIAGMILEISLSKALARMLTVGPLVWIGRLSSYVYIFHWPIFCSLGCGLYIWLRNSLEYRILIVLILVICFICTLLLAQIYIFTSGKIKRLWKDISSKYEKSHQTVL